MVKFNEILEEMKERARKWIEGKGVVRTVFRKLAHWSYSGEELAKQRLLKTIDRKDEAPGPYELQYAIFRQKKELQWVSLYLPLFISLLLSLHLMAGAFLTQNPRNYYISLALGIGLAIYFRTAWFSHYLQGCRSIYAAAGAIWKEALAKSAVANLDTTGQTYLKTVEIPGLKDNLPVSPAEKAENLAKTTIPAVQFQEEELNDTQSVDPKEDISDPPRMLKGSIPLYLMDELIKKECGRPNIYNGDIHTTIKYFTYISRCQPKNILRKIKAYRNRTSIDLCTPNAKSTHLKYTAMLLQHYNEIDDDILYKQAEDLQSFIENSAKRKN